MWKFTIREAIMMTTVVAVLIALWTERKQNTTANERVVSRLAAIESRLGAFDAALNKDLSLPIMVPSSPGAKIVIYRPNVTTTVPLDPPSTRSQKASANPIHKPRISKEKKKGDKSNY
jgi:hypothetical protein